MQFSLIASLIARVHGEAPSLSKAIKLVASAANHKTIVLITSSIDLSRLHKFDAIPIA